MTQDTAKLLMESAVQVLLILLDYGLPIRPPDAAPPQSQDSKSTAPDVPPLPFISPLDTDSQGFNVFRLLLSDIEAPDHLHFMYRGFVRLLRSSYESQSTFLPYSVPRIEIEQVTGVEALVPLSVRKRYSPILKLIKHSLNLLTPP